MTTTRAAWLVAVMSPKPTVAKTRQLRRPRHPHDAATAGRNRIHLVVDDLDAEITRLRAARLPLRSDLISGPGGHQILIADSDET